MILSDHAYPLGSIETHSFERYLWLQGARLSHGHSQQFQYALQSLTLWREIQNDMFKLWCLAEEVIYFIRGVLFSLSPSGERYRMICLNYGV